MHRVNRTLNYRGKQSSPIIPHPEPELQQTRHSIVQILNTTVSATDIMLIGTPQMFFSTYLTNTYPEKILLAAFINTMHIKHILNIH